VQTLVSPYGPDSDALAGHVLRGGIQVWDTKYSVLLLNAVDCVLHTVYCWNRSAPLRDPLNGTWDAMTTPRSISWDP